jgi:hypothetical protein
MDKTAQELADKYKGEELYHALGEAVSGIYEECEAKHGSKYPCKEAQDFLEQEIVTTVWHGTRRRESDKELKQNGFCTYEPPQVDAWLDLALDKVKHATQPGPRKSAQMEKRAEELKHNAREEWRRQVSVSGLKEVSCGWGFRNPELVHDFLWWFAKGKLFNEVLNEMFGEPRRIEIKTNMTARSFMNVQDIHLPRLCIKPEEVVVIEECPTRAEEIHHFPTTARTTYIPLDKVDTSELVEPYRVDEITRLIKKGELRPVSVIKEGDRYSVYPKGDPISNRIEAYRQLGFTKMPAKVAE